MKKFTFLMTVMFALAMPFTLVSCDDDDAIADTLWGVWEGDMHVWSEIDGHVYAAHTSVIQFDRDTYSYSSGTGYWVDYYRDAPWDYFASHITWSVSDGLIRIYSYEDDTNYYIRDYSLGNSYFTGTILSEFGDPMDFRLYKTAAPNWDEYEWGMGAWYAPAKTRSANSEGVKIKRHVGTPDL